MKIEIFNKSFKFIKKLYITVLLIIKFNTVFRNFDQVHYFLIKTKHSIMPYNQNSLYPNKEGQKMEKDVKCLRLLFITKNDPNTEVDLYLIRYLKIRHKGRSLI